MQYITVMQLILYLKIVKSILLLQSSVSHDPSDIILKPYSHWISIIWGPL